MRALESSWKIYCVMCPDGDSGCPDDMVVSFGRSWFLSGRPCFWRPLKWHYVRTSFMFRPDGEPCRVKSHFLAPHVIFPSPFVIFGHLVRFPYAFYAQFSRAHVILAFYLLSRYVFILFY
jgi:hypothetical protein